MPVVKSVPGNLLRICGIRLNFADRIIAKVPDQMRIDS